MRPKGFTFTSRGFIAQSLNTETLVVLQDNTVHVGYLSSTRLGLCLRHMKKVGDKKIMLSEQIYNTGDVKTTINELYGCECVVVLKNSNVYSGRIMYNGDQKLCIRDPICLSHPKKEISGDLLVSFYAIASIRRGDKNVLQND